MEPLYNHPRLRTFRRKLRREETVAEKMLWSQLRARRLDGFKFFRQYSVGQFILDFYCSQARLAIELDGIEHHEGDAPEYDAMRTEYLNGCKIRVIRFDNEEVFSNPNEVIGKIRSVLYYQLQNPL